MSKKYVAYVGSYNDSDIDSKVGLTIFDVDTNAHSFIKREEIEIRNSSYVIAAHTKKVLYTIVDDGVISYKIQSDGSLERMNKMDIHGLRGCHLSTDIEDKYLFVSGYYDGKISVVSLKKDGSFNKFIYGIYHKGLGSANRASTPHVSCTKRTPDGRFVVASDLGHKYIKIYEFDRIGRRLSFCHSMFMPLNCAPQYISFTKDHRFMYVIAQQLNVILAYSYKADEKSPVPDIQLIDYQHIAGVETDEKNPRVVTCMTFTEDEKYILCGSEWDNTVSVFSRDEETGKLEFEFCYPISGEFPKDITLFPDNKHFVSVNHNTSELTFFKLNFERKQFTMCSKTIKVHKPNCCVIVEVDNNETD